jgi:hypothetical protein
MLVHCIWARLSIESGDFNSNGIFTDSTLLTARLVAAKRHERHLGDPHGLFREILSCLIGCLIERSGWCIWGMKSTVGYHHVIVGCILSTMVFERTSFRFLWTFALEYIESLLEEYSLFLRHSPLKLRRALETMLSY